MKKIISTLATIGLGIALAGCGGDGMDTSPVDTGTDTEADCTLWGRVSTCPDGTPGCDRVVCLSHAPRCTNDPWPCMDGGH